MSNDVLLVIAVFGIYGAIFLAAILDEQIKWRKSAAQWDAILADPLHRPAVLLHERHASAVRLLTQTGSLTRRSGPFTMRLDCRLARVCLQIKKADLLIAEFAATARREDVEVRWGEDASGLVEALKLRVAALGEEAVESMLADANDAILEATSDLSETLYAHAPDPKVPTPKTNHMARLTALVTLCRRAGVTTDTELADALKALSATIHLLIERLSADPESEKAMAPLLDYAVPKTREMLTAYLRLIQEKDLEPNQAASLEPVRETLLKLPRLYDDHLALVRSSAITALLDQRDSFEAIALEIDRPRQAVLS